MVVQADLLHGPDGRHFEPQLINMINKTLGAGVELAIGQSDPSVMLNEWLQVELRVSASATTEFVTVDVYEMLKPF